MLSAIPGRSAALDESGNVVAMSAAWHKSTRGRSFDGVAPVGANYLLAWKENGADGEAVLLAELEALLTGDTDCLRRAFSSHWRYARILHGQAVDLPFGRMVVVSVEGGAQSRRSELESANVREAEQRRIARELHDLTAQHLTAIGLHLTMIERMQTPTELRREVQLARQSLGEAHREIRATSYLLHPPWLDHLGPCENVRRFVDGFEQRSGVRVTVRCPKELPLLANGARTAILRIVQEALSNVYHHASALSAQVRLEWIENSVLLEVTDDGAGLPSSVKLGVGIRGMRARAEDLGGSLELCSTRCGTTVRVTLPIQTV